MQEELQRHKFLYMNTPLKQFIKVVLMITLFNFLSCVCSLKKKLRKKYQACDTLLKNVVKWNDCIILLHGGIKVGFI